MPSPHPEQREELWALHRRLGLHRHEAGSTTRSLVAELERVSDLLGRPARRVLSGKLPRRVAEAMAAAAFSQPYLRSLGQPWPRRGEAEDPPIQEAEPPLLLQPEHLEEALGLSAWELEEVREDVDRRATGWLRQHRLVDWLWTRFQLDHAGGLIRLWDVLFPGTRGLTGPSAVYRRGAQLYVALDALETTPRHLFLSWFPAKESPPSRFQARYADGNLARVAARALGLGVSETEQALLAAVTVVPASRAADFLRADRWRSSGLGPLTGLGWPYGATRPLNLAPRSEATEWEHWLALENGQLNFTGPPRAVFDTLAIDRVQEMLRQLYAWVIARATEPSTGEEDLALLDTGLHLDAVLTPLLAWSSDPRTHRHLAQQLGHPIDQVQSRFSDLTTVWSSQLTSAWTDPPHPARSTVLGLLLPHLLILRQGLRAVLQAPPRPGVPHQDLARLFCACYLRDAPVERLWIRGLADLPADPEPPALESIPADWFLGTWDRLLAAMSAGSTFSG